MKVRFKPPTFCSNYHMLNYTTGPMFLDMQSKFNENAKFLEFWQN